MTTGPISVAGGHPVTPTAVAGSGIGLLAASALTLYRRRRQGSR